MSRRVAQIIIAGTGADMSCFATAAALACWAGAAPDNNQSGPATYTASTTHGNSWLQGALGDAAAVLPGC